MAIVAADVAEVEALKAVLGHTAMGATWTLKLFTNNVTPGESDTASTYTEATGFGYVAKTLTGSSWTVATASGTTSGTYAQQTWTFTGALGNVYGYFYVRADTGVLMSAERFSDGPYNIANNGDQISITPTLQLA